VDVVDTADVAIVRGSGYCADVVGGCVVSDWHASVRSDGVKSRECRRDAALGNFERTSSVGLRRTAKLFRRFAALSGFGVGLTAALVDGGRMGRAALFG
jgi:hypothetical protein